MSIRICPGEWGAFWVECSQWWLVFHWEGGSLCMGAVGLLWLYVRAVLAVAAAVGGCFGCLLLQGPPFFFFFFFFFFLFLR